MNSKFENKLSMYLTVKKLLNINNALWAAIAGFASVVTTFFSKITLIKNTENKQARSSKGITQDKKNKKTELIDMMLMVQGGIQSFANDTNDEDLYESVNFTESDLRKLGDSVLVDRAELVLETANNHAADILPKGITAVILGDFQTLITEYDELVPGPRSIIANKKTATQLLTLLFAQEDELLKKNLDKLMLQFKNTQPEFYIDYLNSREVIDLGQQHTRLGGIVTDSEGNPVEGALVRIDDVDLEVETGADGSYLFKPFVKGDSIVTVKKAGFADFEQEIHVVAGQHFVLDVTLAHIVYAGQVNSGQIVNVLNGSTPGWMPGAKVKIKNTTTSNDNTYGLMFYTAINPGDGWSGQGSQLFSGQEEVHIVTAAEFKTCMNIQNQGPNVGSYEVTIL